MNVSDGIVTLRLSRGNSKVESPVIMVLFPECSVSDLGSSRLVWNDDCSQTEGAIDLVRALIGNSRSVGWHTDVLTC